MPLEWWLYPILGAIVGVLAGMLGVGGGLVLVAALAWLLPRQGVPITLAMQVALATSLASIIITACASARAHHRRGSVLWPTVVWLLPGLMLGGIIGSGLAVNIASNTLRLLVAGYCLLAAAQLILELPKSRVSNTSVPRGPLWIAAGSLIGTVSAIVGIGGGSMTVPLLVWRGVKPVNAVGTASACGIGIALASAAGYAGQHPVLPMPPGSIGYVYLPAAIGVAVVSIFTAPMGARLAHHVSDRTLKRSFAVFLVTIAVLLLLSA